MQTEMRKTSVIIAGLIAGLSFIPMVALADSITFELGSGNSDISTYTGPYASVKVDRTTPTTANITFTSLQSTLEIFLFGGNGAVAVNVNAPSWTLSSISGSNGGTGFTPGPWSNGGAKNEDGWGSFNQTIDSFDGYTHSSDTISFLLTNTGGGSWIDAASVLTGNNYGYTAAAHIFVATKPANATSGALATGYATNGYGNEPVPEPATMLLFGSGLAGLAGVIKLRKKKNA